MLCHAPHPINTGAEYGTLSLPALWNPVLQLNMLSAASVPGGRIISSVARYILLDWILLQHPSTP